MQIDLNFALKQAIVVIEPIDLAEGKLCGQLIVQDFGICIKSKFDLSSSMPVELRIDPQQVIFAIVLQPVLGEEDKENEE